MMRSGRRDGYRFFIGIGAAVERRRCGIDGAAIASAGCVRGQSRDGSINLCGMPGILGAGE